jgi:hypothetical protein
MRRRKGASSDRACLRPSSSRFRVVVRGERGKLRVLGVFEDRQDGFLRDAADSDTCVANGSFQRSFATS